MLVNIDNQFFTTVSASYYSLSHKSEMVLLVKLLLRRYNAFYKEKIVWRERTYRQSANNKRIKYLQYSEYTICGAHKIL